MKLRQQFAVLTAVVALLIAISCGVGYYMASSMLTDSIEHQLTAIVKEKETMLTAGLPTRLPC